MACFREITAGKIFAGAFAPLPRGFVTAIRRTASNGEVVYLAGDFLGAASVGGMRVRIRSR
jgi:hypothetical protein